MGWVGESRGRKSSSASTPRYGRWVKAGKPPDSIPTLRKQSERLDAVFEYLAFGRIRDGYGRPEDGFEIAEPERHIDVPQLRLV